MKRVGKIKISRDLLKMETKECIFLLKDFLCVHTENNIIEDSITMWGYCLQFEEIEPCQETPLYQIVVETIGESKIVKFIKENK